MSAVIPVPNRYARSRDGLTIHRIDCKRVGPRHVEWRWAEGMDPDEIYDECESKGLHYHWCLLCFPRSS